MKNLVDNYFDDIGVSITHNGEDIDINIMNINRKTSKFILFIWFCPPSVSQKGENYNISNDKNKKDIKLEKTDNKDDHWKNINLAELLLYNTF